MLPSFEEMSAAIRARMARRELEKQERIAAEATPVRNIAKRAPQVVQVVDGYQYTSDDLPPAV
jgi:hypothetical protein